MPKEGKKPDKCTKCGGKMVYVPHDIPHIDSKTYKCENCGRTVRIG